MGYDVFHDITQSLLVGGYSQTVMLTASPVAMFLSQMSTIHITSRIAELLLMIGDIYTTAFDISRTTP